jgi:predicted nucleic acid-binding protein
LKAAFIDTSAVAAVLFQEPGFNPIHRCFLSLERLYASGLLEAEIRASAAREGLEARDVETALSQMNWVFPDRPLSQELDAVIRTGVPLRGADLWHVACALYLARDPAHLDFITLDSAQAEAAKALGFKVLPGEGRGPSGPVFKPGGSGGMGIHEPGAAYRGRVSKKGRKAPK